MVALDAHVAPERLAILGVEDCRHVERSIAVRTNDLQSSNGSVVQLLGGFRFQDWIGDRFDLVSVLVIRLVLGAELVLSRVNAEALSNEVHLDSIDVLDQPGDWRQQLLSNVPVTVDLQVPLLVHVLVGAVGEVANRGLASLLCGTAVHADDVRDEIVDQVGIALSLSFHSDGNLDMRQVPRVRVVFCLAGELFGDDEVGERNRAVLELLANV